jgi:hypothetical protein
MAYTAQNIANIKRAGNLNEYIAMERKLIESLRGAEITETDTSLGGGRMQTAHIYGEYSAGEDFINAKGGIYASDARCLFGDMDKEFKNFQSLNAAKQYARAALRNHIQAFADSVLSDANSRLAALEAA